ILWPFTYSMTPFFSFWLVSKSSRIVSSSFPTTVAPAVSAADSTVIWVLLVIWVFPSLGRCVQGSFHYHTDIPPGRVQPRTRSSQPCACAICANHYSFSRNLGDTLYYH